MGKVLLVFCLLYCGSTVLDILISGSCLLLFAVPVMLGMAWLLTLGGGRGGGRRT